VGLGANLVRTILLFSPTSWACYYVVVLLLDHKTIREAKSHPYETHQKLSPSMTGMLIIMQFTQPVNISEFPT
jgi:hypothetical protein